MNKELKYLILFSLLTLLGCGNEEDAVSGIVPPQVGETLQLTVSAADFVTDGAPDTRATDNDKTTTFDDNDRVGVIILDAGNKLIYDNIPYVYNNDKWTFDSKNDEGKGGCYYDTKAVTYIVYYPYSRAADKVTSVDELKTKFAPKFNQSDIKDYRSSDLMVWNSKGHLASSVTTLDAELEHAFASVYLTPTVGSYILDDGNGTAYKGSYTPTVSDISDVSLTIDNAVYVPFQAPDGSLRCIVPAGITPGDIRCFYTIGSKTYGNTISISSDAVAVNTRYACEPEIGDVTYSLSNAHIGDFYCKNNNNEVYLIPGDVALPPEQQAACIGIVFWVGDATQKDQTLRSDHPDCTHGLVVALNDVAGETAVWQSSSSYSSVQGWLDNNRNDVYLSVASGTGSNDPLNNIQGYNNTKAIEKFNAANNGNIVQAVVKVDDYRKKVLVPDNSSKWYLPSEKELTLLCGKDVNNIWSNNSGGTTANKNLINSKLSSISSVATTISSAYYWSSTEYSASDAFSVYFGSGYVNNDNKYYAYRVRCVLAF